MTLIARRYQLMVPEPAGLMVSLVPPVAVLSSTDPPAASERCLEYYQPAVILCLESAGQRELLSGTVGDKQSGDCELYTLIFRLKVAKLLKKRPVSEYL